jgi:hypothetical protein
VLARAVKTLEANPRHHGKLELLRLWVYFAEAQTKAPTHTFFGSLEEQGIGTKHALFYESWAASLESKQLHTQAHAVYAKGIKSGAEPLWRLKERYASFNRRQVRRQQKANLNSNSVGLRKCRKTPPKKAQHHLAGVSKCQLTSTDSERQYRRAAIEVDSKVKRHTAEIDAAPLAQPLATPQNTLTTSQPLEMRCTNPKVDNDSNAQGIKAPGMGRAAATVVSARETGSVFLRKAHGTSVPRRDHKENAQMLPCGNSGIPREISQKSKAILAARRSSLRLPTKRRMRDANTPISARNDQSNRAVKRRRVGSMVANNGFGGGSANANADGALRRPANSADMEVHEVRSELPEANEGNVNLEMNSTAIVGTLPTKEATTSIRQQLSPDQDSEMLQKIIKKCRGPQQDSQHLDKVDPPSSGLSSWIPFWKRAQ